MTTSSSTATATVPARVSNASAAAPISADATSGSARRLPTSSTAEPAPISPPTPKAPLRYPAAAGPMSRILIAISTTSRLIAPSIAAAPARYAISARVLGSDAITRAARATCAIPECSSPWAAARNGRTRASHGVSTHSPASTRHASPGPCASIISPASSGPARAPTPLHHPLATLPAVSSSGWRTTSGTRTL